MPSFWGREAEPGMTSRFSGLISLLLQGENKKSTKSPSALH